MNVIGRTFPGDVECQTTAGNAVDRLDFDRHRHRVLRPHQNATQVEWPPSFRVTGTAEIQAGEPCVRLESLEDRVELRDRPIHVVRIGFSFVDRAEGLLVQLGGELPQSSRSAIGNRNRRFHSFSSSR